MKISNEAAMDVKRTTFAYLKHYRMNICNSNLKAEERKKNIQKVQVLEEILMSCGLMGEFEEWNKSGEEA